MQRELSHPRVRKGPVYLARRGRDGVVSVECEFKSSTRLGFTEYHVMTPLDRLQARAQIESLTTSQVAMKEPGLWGAQALLEAADKSLPGLSSLCSDSRECVLDDAIEAHRDDVLRFFLERGVSSVVMRVKNPLRPPHVGELWEVGRRDWRDDPLFVAIARGTPDSVHVLLEHGANPDAVGDPNPFSGADTFFPARALAWAVEHGRLTLVQTLLEHGADPNLAVSSLAPLSTTLSDIVNEKPLAEVQAAGVHQLFLHGADPNPPLSAAFQTYARIKAREDLAAKARNSPDQTVQTQWVKEAIITPGPSEALAEAMLNDTLAFRDASDCEPSASLAELAICLPNTLKRANAALDRSRQNRSLAAVDRKCDTHLAGLHTRAGWLSYVLSDQSRALCVLAELRVQKRT